MQTQFTEAQLSDPSFRSSEEELRACLQCDYCLKNCPTYQLTGDALDSPRGRIFLIKEMLESGAPPDVNTVHHIDRCLTCLACMATCPSSVHYLHLVDHARDYIDHHFRRPWYDRTVRALVAWVLPVPSRLRMVLRFARLLKHCQMLLPKSLRPFLSMAPASVKPPSPNDKPQVFPASGKRNRRVALLTGCAQTVLNTDINDATIRILRRHGCEVVVASGLGCCGALPHHMGKSDQSRALAKRNIQAWTKEINDGGLDAIVFNTSGCGTVIKDYGFMFREEDFAHDARNISDLAKDISEILSDLELEHRNLPGLKVAYHPTCSLQFGQRIRFMPKRLLKEAGFSIVEPRDANACCGFAGTYSLLQPELSNKLRDRKARAMESGDPDVIATGNIGCLMQIASGTAVPVVHTVELLDWATGGPIPRALADGTALDG